MRCFIKVLQFERLSGVLNNRDSLLIYHSKLDIISTNGRTSGFFFLLLGSLKSTVKLSEVITTIFRKSIRFSDRTKSHDARFTLSSSLEAHNL